MRSAPTFALALAAGIMGRRASAHGVPGDPDPGRALYLMPGALFSMAVPLRGERVPLLMDLGVEVSVHRFVPTNRSILGQFGYGAFAQAQVGGIELQSGGGPSPSAHFRLALGAQGSYGVLGAQAALVTRTLGREQSTMLGGFAGVFFSFGLCTASFQVELPFVHVGRGEDLPAMFVGAITLKWPVVFDRERDATR